MADHIVIPAQAGTQSIADHIVIPAQAGTQSKSDHIVIPAQAGTQSKSDSVRRSRGVVNSVESELGLPLVL